MSSASSALKPAVPSDLAASGVTGQTTLKTSNRKNIGQDDTRSTARTMIKSQSLDENTDNISGKSPRHGKGGGHKSDGENTTALRTPRKYVTKLRSTGELAKQQSKKNFKKCNWQKQADENDAFQQARVALKRTHSAEDLQKKSLKPNSPPHHVKRFRSAGWQGTDDIATAPGIAAHSAGLERGSSEPNLVAAGRRPPNPRHGRTPPDRGREWQPDEDFKENIDPQRYPSALIETHTRRRRIRRPAEGPPATAENALLRLPGSDRNVRVEVQPAAPVEEDTFSDAGDDELLASVDIEALFGTAVEKRAQTATAPASEAASVLPLSPPMRATELKRFDRFLVLEVSRSEYELEPPSPTGIRSHEQILRLLDESSQKERWLHLREDWWQMDVDVGDYLHLVHGEFDSTHNRCIADNSGPTLVTLHPDCLISATSLSESFGCLRKAILQDRVRSQGDITPPLVYGKMMHCLLQTCLKANDFSTARIEREIDGLVLNGIEDLHAIGEDEAMAKAHLAQFVPGLRTWAAVFVGPAPKPDAIVHKDRGTGTRAPEKTTMCINKILDIEENIWSPTYGIKGMIDASVQVRVRQGSEHPKTFAAPFEFKTGKSTSVVAHHAQTVLYTLMMSDRYDVNVSSGLLYYMREGGLVHVPGISHEIRGLMIARNAMACHLNKKTKLPSVIQNPDTCKRCYALDKCLLYHKAVELGTAETSGVGPLFDERTSHLTPAHLRFFEKWERLITMEEGDLHSQRKEIWTLLGSEREKKGTCFSGLQIMHKSAAGSGSTMQYRFGKAVVTPSEGSSTAEPEAPVFFTSSQIAVGDMVVVSTEAGHYALAVGFVSELQPSSVTISMNRELRGPPRRIADNFDEESNQSFQGVLEEDNETECSDTTLYRIDKDELTSGMGFVRANLVALLAQEGNERQRRLIVDQEPPTFQHDAEKSAAVSAAMDPSLNADQQKAVEMVMSTRDYTLILGMPGTGKTTTIAHIIRALVKLGKSVLLTSYTHTAVDNVLLKLREDVEPVDFLRLGSNSKIHPAIASSNTLAAANLETVAQLEKFYASKRVVATTCLGLGHSLFSKRRFDYCIVDEASQLTLPVCLGPLRFADAFVLVGDNYQLPPLVRNLNAREQGLTSSLFKILSEAHPAAVVNLEHQYRMCEDIMLLSNVLVYGHRLRCGTAEVANARLALPAESEGVSAFHAADASCNVNSEACWLRRMLKPENRVVFLNTDEVPGPEIRPSNDRVQNDVEAILVAQCVEALLRCGVDEQDMGVISPYRSQLKTIGQALRNRRNVAIQTVDKFQGSDKECVIVSLVRSNPTGNVGELLRDWRRINVAFTRAKKKLIIIGSRQTLNNTGVFPEIFKIIDEKKWELMLPANAHSIHAIPVPSAVPAPSAEDRFTSRSQELTKASSRHIRANHIAAKSPNAGVGLLGHLLEEA